MTLKEWVNDIKSQLSLIVAAAGIFAGMFGSVWGLSKSLDMKEEVQKNTYHRIQHETLLTLPRVDRRLTNKKETIYND